MQNEKERSQDQFWEEWSTDAQNWSSLQERSPPAATFIFRRVTFAFGILLKEKLKFLYIFLKDEKIVLNNEKNFFIFIIRVTLKFKFDIKENFISHDGVLLSGESICGLIKNQDVNNLNQNNQNISFQQSGEPLVHDTTSAPGGTEAPAIGVSCT